MGMLNWGWWRSLVICIFTGLLSLPSKLSREGNQYRKSPQASKAGLWGERFGHKRHLDWYSPLEREDWLHYQGEENEELWLTSHVATVYPRREKRELLGKFILLHMALPSMGDQYWHASFRCNTTSFCAANAGASHPFPSGAAKRAPTIGALRKGECLCFGVWVIWDGYSPIFLIYDNDCHCFLVCTHTKKAVWLAQDVASLVDWFNQGNLNLDLQQY